jgi:DNA-binding MarR family transcriptional regulator
LRAGAAEVGMAKKRRVSGLDAHLGYWLRFVSNHVSQAFTRKVEAKGVTVAEWVLLRELFGLGPTSPSRVADCLGMTRGAISKLVERLRLKKLVTRTASDDDGRAHVVALTAAGNELVPVLARLADENDREFFGHLTDDERNSLAGALREIVRRHEWKDVPTS